MSLEVIIREAIIKHQTRIEQYTAIEYGVGCNRATAKQLFYAFIYCLDEDYLQNLLKNS